MLRQKTYNTTAGLTYINTSDLAYRTVFRVTRGTDVHYITVSELDILITGDNVRYAPSVGGLYFDESIPFELNERINVIYEI